MSITYPWKHSQNLSKSERFQFLVAVVVVALNFIELLTGEIAGPGGLGYTPHHFMWSAFIYTPLVTNCFLSIFVLHALVAPGRRRLLTLGLVGGALELWLVYYRSVTGTPEKTFYFGTADLDVWQNLYLVGDGLGVVAIVSFALSAFQSSGEHRSRAWGYFVLAIAIPISKLFGGYSMTVVNQKTPYVYDLWGYCLDTGMSIFGVQPAYWLSYHTLAFKPALVLTLWVYNALPCYMILAIAASLRSRQGTYFNVLAVYTILGFVGMVGYAAVPMVGYCDWPCSYPAGPLPQILSLEMIQVSPLAPRNCMPSLHVAWAYAAHCGIAATVPRLRAGSGFFLALTCISTIWGGGHYIINLFVSFPITLCVIAACCWRLPVTDTLRLQCCAVATVLVVVWFTIFFGFTRFFSHHGGLLATYCLGMMTISFYAEGRLRRACQGELDRELPGPASSEP